MGTGIVGLGVVVLTMNLSVHELAACADKEGFIAEEIYKLWFYLGSYQTVGCSEVTLGLPHYQRAGEIYQDLGEPKNHVYAGLLMNQANANGLLDNHEKQNILFSLSLTN